MCLICCRKVSVCPSVCDFPAWCKTSKHIAEIHYISHYLTVVGMIWEGNWNFRYQALSLPGAKVPYVWYVCRSMELSIPWFK